MSKEREYEFFGDCFFFRQKFLAKTEARLFQTYPVAFRSFRSGIGKFMANGHLFVSHFFGFV